MNSRKDIFNKYYASDIFNQDPNFGVTPTKPKPKLNRSSLETTKEEVFNIGKEKRINRNLNKNEENNEKEKILNHSAEKRRKNLSKLYGSDIFNTRKAASIERRRGKQINKNSTNKSTCFESMKNNQEYAKDLKYYTKQHRGEKKEYNPDLYLDIISPQERYFENYYGNNCEGVLPGTYLNSEGNIDDIKLNYIKKKINLHKDEKVFNDVGADKKRKEGENVQKEVRYVKNHPITVYKGDKRRFVDIDEFPENNCRINKQIQFESHIFTNEKNNFNKSNDDIKEINDRIDRERNKHYHINVLGQPIIRVNRNKDIEKNATNQKLRPANIKWNSPQAEVMFGRDHSSNIYKKYGPKGPNAYQLKLYQFSDSGNLDTLSGAEKSKYQNMERPKKEEALNNETTKKIEKMVDDLPNLNDRQKNNIKMRTSVLDCNDDNEWDNKAKTLNDFYKKGKNNKIKNKEITEKVNNIDKKPNNNKDYGFHDYVITYATKGNQFEKFDDNEIKNIFGKKGVSVYDIHKNPFSKGSYNTISLKILGNDNNNEISKKVKLVQDDLKKKNYKINIEKGKEKNHNKNNKRIMNNPGAKIGIMPDISNNNGESKFKIMPTEYKNRKGFTKEFRGINFSYKKPNQ